MTPNKWRVLFSNRQNKYTIFQLYWKKSEDTKGVIRLRKSKKDRQHNGQKKKYKGQI